LPKNRNNNPKRPIIKRCSIPTEALQRLIGNLTIISPVGKFVNLRELFITARCHSGYLIKKIIENSPEALTGRDIQNLLAAEPVD